jgi:hypothetical protein
MRVESSPVVNKAYWTIKYGDIRKNCGTIHLFLGLKCYYDDVKREVSS